MSPTSIQDIISTYLITNRKKILIKNGKLLINEIERELTDEEIADGKLTDDIAREETRKYYADCLKKVHFSHLVILSGAGTSVKVGLSNDGKGGLTMAGLWDALNSSGLIKLHKLENDKEVFDDFCFQVGYSPTYEDGSIIKDLEKLLDVVQRKAFSNESLLESVDIIKKFIIKCCSLQINDLAPHKKLLRKITKRKLKDARIKLFTTNYDTLWEQAAAADRFTILDGFTYTYPRYFNGRFFDYDVVVRHRTRNKDEDSFIPKLFHLYKLHGSLSWKIRDKEIIQTDIDLTDNNKPLDQIAIDNRLMVFPTTNKYESTYEAPYFEMMSRLQQSLRQENTLLITIGFSFLDKHISNVIEETLKQNPSLNLFVIDPSIDHQKENWKKLFAYTEIDNRTVLINDYFKDFADNYPENDSFEQQDLMNEFAVKLTTLLNGSAH